MKTKQTDLLRLNLQFFSEEPPADPTPEPTITITQAEFDRRIGERLAREKAKSEQAVADAKAEAERLRLEGESEFKTLYEQSQARIIEIEAQAKVSELQAKKQALLLEAGYPADKLADVLAFITGDDEVSVNASIERFKSVAPPTPPYVDPAANGGAGRQQPEQKNAVEYGKELFKSRIKK